ncbi:MAG: protein kinase [Bryobacteraceae bacterium]
MDTNATGTIRPDDPDPSRRRSPSSLEWMPEVIDEYRIVRLIGEGGMGAVYEAEQSRPRRTVALKVIKLGPASDFYRQRFEIESQALALLQHPGIAQIYAAGTASTPTGGLLPYFAMEFIRGSSLTEYAQKNRLNTRQRLELMIKVCEAVNHAHQRGIIHRDLKPGNILVDEAGNPKVLDFGVARMTNSDIEATRQTDVGQLVGTLPYMSPEQVLADPAQLDTRSDIYALGVILYELLAGKLPYRIDKKLLHEAVRTITEEEAPPLSSTDRSFRGDIDVIVRKALEKDKNRRYASAASLAGDLARHLRDEPIIARPPSTTYQLQKFARRHKPFVLGLAAVFLVLVLGVIASTTEAVRASRAEKLATSRRALAEQRQTEAEQALALAEQRRRQAEDAKAAEEQARRSEASQRLIAEQRAAEAKLQSQRAEHNFTMARDAVDRYLTKVSESKELKAKGLENLRQNLLETAKDFYQQFVAERSGDPSLQMQMGAALFRLGNLDIAINHTSEGEQELLRAIGIMEKLHQAHPNDARQFNDLIGASNNLANLYQSKGSFQKAESVFTGAIERQEEWNRTHEPSIDSLTNLGNLYDGLGTTLVMSFGRTPSIAKAEAPRLRALEIRKEITAKYPGEAAKRALLVSNVNLTELYGMSNRADKARPYAEAAVTIAEELSQANPNDPDSQNALSSSLNNLGGVYALLEDLPASEKAHRRALDVREKLAREHPAVAEYALNLAASYVNLGELGQRMGKPAESLLLLQKAAEGLTAVLAREPKSVFGRYAMRFAYYWQARDFADLQRYSDAVGAWDTAIRFDDYHDSSLRAGSALALARAGRIEEAEARAGEASGAKNVSGESWYLLAQTYAVCAAAGSGEKREELGQKSIADLRQAAVGGYFKDPAKLDLAAKDPLLEGVRRREDFVELWRGFQRAGNKAN